MADWGEIAAAIGNTQSKNVAGVDALRQQLLGAIFAAETAGDLSAHGPADMPAAESLLACILESFLQAGPDGKELLDQLLLDILPQLAALAPTSEQCSVSLCGFCGFAASACTPRETITVFLEVIDQLLPAASARPHTLCFLCTLLSYLPQLLAKLPKRQAAFAKECLAAAAALAKAHGEVLNSWMLLQLRQMALHCRAHVTDGNSGGSSAASEGLVDDWQRADTFLAACWQPYSSFVGDVLHKVLMLEADAATQHSAKLAAREFILQLVLHLTAPWQPAPLHRLALQLASTPVAAAQLPSAETVTAPVALLAQRQHGNASSSNGDATDVLRSFLELLQESGATDWTSMTDCAGHAAAGAAMLALYDFVLSKRKDDQLALPPPPTATQTVQLACRWAVALFDASEGNPLIIIKAIAFLQAAAQLASSRRGTAQFSEAAADSMQTGAIAADHLYEDNSEGAKQLLPDLQPALTMLGTTMVQASGTPLSSQAALALQQLLRALAPGLLHASLNQMLNGSSGLHHEVAALLMQEVRMQLAQPTLAGASHIFTTSSCIQLVLPWLQSCGSAGWGGADLLPDKANVICAALAVVRMAVLKEQHIKQEPVYRQHSSSNCTTVEQLCECLLKLSGAVSTALQQLQQESTADHELQNLPGWQDSHVLPAVPNSAQQEASTSVAKASQEKQEQKVIPGEATGAGQAVDAWLAVSRVQDVLSRVLELLHSCSGG